MIKNYNAIALIEDCSISFHDICGDNGTVMDFWTIRCTRCPAALDKLNKESNTHPSIKFISCVLGDVDVAKDMVEGMWENLTHIGVDIQTKEHLKEDYKFSQVPFCVVINKDKQVVYSGDPKSIDFSTITELINSTPQAIDTKPAYDNNDSNTSSAATASTTNDYTYPMPTTSSTATSTISNQDVFNSDDF